MTSSTTRAGSPAYMAPETLLEGKATPISDIWSLGVIIYELATLKRPNFLGDKEPKDVFINGWKPDLSAVEDDSMRIILKKIFVLDPVKWPTARSLQKLLNPSVSSMGMLKLRIASLEDALGAAGARTGALGEAIAALKGRIDAQSAEIASLRAGNRVAALSEAERQSVQTSKSSLDLNKHRPSNPQAASRNAISLLRSLASKYGPWWTPLMRAAINGSIEIARRHLSDKDKKNNDGDTAYTLASKAGQDAILELLDPTDEDGETALMRAAERGDVEAVRALIPLQKKRATSNNISERGSRTALMMAAARGHTEVVKLLVEHEGGTQDNCGYTAPMFAAKSGHADCAKLLLEREICMQDKIGVTALMFAALGNHTECVKLLTEKEKKIRNAGGKTALDIAKNCGHIDVISILTK